ncbi:SEC61 beta subunit domain protein [Metarhizium robertsii]|uniref:Preprotein translocase Sec, Sec61-beta subunit n=2 Tax=Metarhizium robertsii TaxID=568076 RepID=E9EKR4_METRA
MSSPRASSPANSPAAASGANIGRPSSPTPPGGPRTAIRRRAAADQKEKIANARPTSTRSAGAGGSSSTMLSMPTQPLPLITHLPRLRPSAVIVGGWKRWKSMADRLFAGLYTDESPGLKVDPVIVLVLSLVFIFSVVALHVIAKITRRFSS